MKKMRLSDAVCELMKREGLSQTEFGAKCGLERNLISFIINEKYVAMRTVVAIADVYPEIKQFVKYEKCKICGKDFVPYRRSLTCSKECSSINAKQLKEEAYMRMRSDKRNLSAQTDAMRFNWNIKDLKSPEKSIGEFMDGRPYAERQKEYLLNLQKEQRMEIK